MLPMIKCQEEPLECTGFQTFSLAALDLLSVEKIDEKISIFLNTYSFFSIYLL